MLSSEIQRIHNSAAEKLDRGTLTEADVEELLRVLVDYGRRAFALERDGLPLRTIAPNNEDEEIALSRALCEGETVVLFPVKPPVWYRPGGAA